MKNKKLGGYDDSIVLYLDIEQVTVGVEVVKSVGVHLHQLFEEGHCILHLPHVVVANSNL